MEPDPARRTVSIAQAMALLQVSRRTIALWMKAGKVEYVRTSGGSPRIFLDTLWRKPEAQKAAR